MNLTKGFSAALILFAASTANAADTPEDGTLNMPNISGEETHASGADNAEALQLARSNKEAFVGKDLYFANGQEVGKILDVRRWTRDMELYMVVDAEPFFSEQVDYAVPVGEVSRVLSDRVELPEAPGMHLRGMEYYPEDFEDMDAGEQIPLIVDE